MPDKKLILIVDDEEDFVKTVRTRLELEGFETTYAYEGVRAIEAAHKKKPDLILLDIKMPSGRGDTVLKNLRSQQDTKKIPVLIITGLTQPGLKEQIKRDGAQDFLSKPFDMNVLVEKIQHSSNKILPMEE